MIKGFRDHNTRRVFERHRVARWPFPLQRSALRRLLILDAADALQDLRVPPGNRLEKFAGERAGHYGIRIHAQWRVCFRWRAGDAYEVGIVDYD